MTMHATGTAVRTEVVVEAPIERAFSVFTDDIGSWWSPDHHLLQGELAEMVFEPREGGHVYDRGVDGSECRWARVLAYEPPTDLERTSEVEVGFSVEGAERTRVTLEHRNLDRHGEGWEGMRDAVGSPEGWPDGLRLFAERLSA
jgi:uncharacterized protein YndB with AHSA1/START domain